MRISSLAVVAAIALAPSVATSQTAPAKLPFALPPESVTVVGVKPSDETIKSFVEKRAEPTAVLRKMARWRRPVCPVTLGLGDKYAKYVTQRIRDVAKAVGAPVNADAGCRPNIEVVFTTAPQGLMDNVHNTSPLYLGYYHDKHEADELAKVTHGVQGWYTTESLDWDGSTTIDTGNCRNDTTVNFISDAGMSSGLVHNSLVLPCAIVTHAIGGTRLNDALNSGFFNILIVAEPAKLYDYEVGALADYITMLALSQPASLDSCQELPSISNMLAPSCTSVSSRITDGDLAYLQALYKLLPGQTMSVQRDEMLFEMKKTLVTDKGG
jgi:hypothetical protein